MIRRERLIRKLEELGAICVESGQRNHVFKLSKRGQIYFASVPMRDRLESDHVRDQLRYMGCNADEIEEFVNQNQCGQ